MLAKRAAEKSKRKPDYDRCPLSDVKRRIRLDLINEWNRRYQDGDVASITKYFFLDAIEAYRTIRKIKITQHMTQAMTGHAGFAEYLNKFKCKTAASCVCDPAVAENILHLLCYCPQFGKERNNTEIILQTKIVPSNFGAIIAGKLRRIYKILYRYS